MKCRRVQKRLSAFQDGELRPKEQLSVREHLGGCPACRERYAELEGAWKALGDLKEIVPEPGFYGQLFAKIKESDATPLRVGFRWLFQGFSSPWAASTLLVAGILMGAFLGNFLGRSDLFSFRPGRVVDSQIVCDVFSLKAFEPMPPGTLGDQYVRMASHAEGEHR